MADKDIYTIAHLKPGDRARIVKLSGKPALRRRLLDMGIISNAVIEMIRPAPLGDPVQIKIKGYHLSLRKAEAAHILVERLK